MFSIDLEQRCLLELLKASLFCTTPELPDKVNWEKIFVLARSQCVVPLIASYVPREFRDNWLNLTYQNKAHYMQLIHEQNSLVQLFKNNNIPFAILKGTAAAIYYPNPSLRTYGDIDFCVSNDFFDSAKSLLDNANYSFISNNERQFVYKKNGIEFELHLKFSSKHYKNNIDHIVLNGLANFQIYKVANNAFPGLSTYENGIVLLGHILQHLKESGIGLRQIIDWMMFVHQELDDTSWEKHFRRLALEAGLEKLAITVTYMCKKWFQLPDSITWCDKADEDAANRLLIQIFEDGNFGLDRAPYEIIKKSIRDEGAFKYLQRSGMLNWPLANKYIIFKPFAWFYQLCRYACIGISGLFNGKKIFSKTSHTMSLEELLKRLEQ